MILRFRSWLDERFPNVPTLGRFLTTGSTEPSRCESHFLTNWASQVFGIDVRSLAAFRIGLAILLLLDLRNRALFLTAHYTDVGVLPRAAKLSFYDKTGVGGTWQYWSFHMTSGVWWGQAILFILAGVFAGCMLVGYRTRLATILSWILLLSLHNRNIALLQGGDLLLKAMVFWAMFLPLGAIYSIDRARSKTYRQPPTRILSGGTIALLVQVGYVYVFTSLQKSHADWTTNLSAIHYALSLEFFSKPAGTWLLQFPGLLRFLTWSTAHLEFYGGLLAFFPFFTGWIRRLLVPLFWSFHLGLWATMELGLFSAICVVAWIPFLPSSIWDILGRRWPVPVWPRSSVQLPRSVVSWMSSLVAIAMLLLVGINITRKLPAYYQKQQPLAAIREVIFPHSLVYIRLTQLDQQWKMFSPHPQRHDGWYEIAGELRDGTVVNLWDPSIAPSRYKPHNISAIPGGQRWRKYFDQIRDDSYKHHRKHFCDWLRWRWDNRYAKDYKSRVKKVRITFHVEVTQPPGQPPRPAYPVVLYDWIY